MAAGALGGVHHQVVGRLLYRHVNFPVRVLTPRVVGDAGVLTPTICRHYAAPLATPDERMGAWACAKALTDSGPWFDALWSHRARLHDWPMLLCWGATDATFGPAYLARWRRAFPSAQVHTLASIGHFVPEEAPTDAGARLEAFARSDPHAVLDA